MGGAQKSSAAAQQTTAATQQQDVKKKTAADITFGKNTRFQVQKKDKVVNNKGDFPELGDVKVNEQPKFVKEEIKQQPI